MSRRKRIKPTDLYCLNCLEETLSLKDSEHLERLFYCESCRGKWKREQVLTFDEMTEAKFERVKNKNLNQLKRDMRP